MNNTFNINIIFKYYNIGITTNFYLTLVGKTHYSSRIPGNQLYCAAFGYNSVFHTYPYQSVTVGDAACKHSTIRKLCTIIHSAPPTLAVFSLVPAQLNEFDTKHIIISFYLVNQFN